MHRCLTLLFALGVTSDEHLHLMRFGLSLSSGRGGAGVTTLFGRTAAFAMATFLSLLGPDLEGELLELTSDDEEPEDCPGLPMLGSAGGSLVQPSYVYHGVYCAGSRAWSEGCRSIGFHIHLPILLSFLPSLWFCMVRRAGSRCSG